MPISTPKLVKLSNSKLMATVDLDDFQTVAKFNWHLVVDDSNINYAETKTNGKRLRLHHLILGKTRIDHKDGNGLNNTRSSLRNANSAQNTWNKRKYRGKSIYKGVSPYRDGVRWVAQISEHHEKHYLGLYHSEIEAARAYDKSAKIYFGEFAKLNFPEELNASK